MIRNRPDCRLCGSSVEQVYELPPMPIANSFPEKPDRNGRRYPLRLMQCLECDHVQLQHVVSGLFTADYRYRTPVTRHLESAAKSLRTRFPKHRMVLEIGSNNGSFLTALREQGFNALGIDPANTDEGSVTDCFTDYTAANFRCQFDLIVANNVFAHIDNLDDVFAGINRIFKDSSALVFETQHLPDLINRGAFDMIYHEHLDYHTLRPLRLFLRKHNLVMTEWEALHTHGGSIRVTAMRVGAECAVPDEALRWPRLDQAIAAAKKKLRASGRMVAFGASAKSSILINTLGIEDKIAYCVDDTEVKQGRYIPGTDIEIRPVSALGNEDVLLSAWNYEKEIRARIPNRLVNPFA